MGAVVNPSNLFFNTQDGVLKIAITEQPKEIILF